MTHNDEYVVKVFITILFKLLDYNEVLDSAAVQKYNNPLLQLLIFSSPRLLTGWTKNNKDHLGIVYSKRYTSKLPYVIKIINEIE